MLSGKEIKKQIAKGNIIIKPYNESQIGPNSYDITLHNELLVYTDKLLDMKVKPNFEMIEIPKDGLILQPGVLYLGRTAEYTETKKFIPMIEGRSSIGRLGMFIHITAGFGDIGFSGSWTLEIQVIHPLRIYPNTRIGQIYYHKINGKYDTYGSTKNKSGKYNNNCEIQPSLMHMDFKK